jgi:hypothetical protein
MNDLLKGNYKVSQAPKAVNEANTEPHSLNEKFRQKAIEGVGGSMVFVERNKMTWDPKQD